MAMVGEMVDKHKTWHNARSPIDLSTADTLRELGIWDAEVLELPVCRLHCADCAFHLQFPSALLPEPGATVRVIVLKEE